MTPQISAHESAHEYDSQVLSEALSDSQPSEPPSRFGVSISQKVSKRAVVRNRIKRQLHAAIQHLRPRLSPGWLVVIVVRSAALECVYEDFLQELEQLLIESEVINGH
jgi:ribonuclease P protein component